MKEGNVRWIAVTTIACAVAIAGSYVFWQYATARPPALDSIPTCYIQASVTDIPDPQRSDAEAKLRDMAASARPGYRITAERFLAAAEYDPFTWDLVRHCVGPFLRPGYALDHNGYSADNTATYCLYQHVGKLRRQFNDDLILVAGLVKKPLETSTGEHVHLYAYFSLSPG